ncbi:MAG: hypothetical protein COA63_004010 [Methylophaga sp.]|nr:hypothetical protein [Methylophaga sp.]
MNFNNKITVALIALSALFFSVHSYAEEEYIEAHFQIDVANQMQQLSWISEMAFRLSDYQKKIQSGEIKGTNEVFCDAPLMTTNTFIVYLNKNHQDELISADQAIETVFMELGAAFPCPE